MNLLWGKVLKILFSNLTDPIYKIKGHSPFLFFITLLFCLGLFIFRDYGFPWDEIYQLDLIHRTYNYVNHWDTQLLDYQFRYMGTGSELLLLAFCRLFPSISEVYARHLGIFLIFLSGLIPVYLIGMRLFKSKSWALLAVIFLTLSPRIFGDAFYNSKDIPFMVTFCWAILSLYKMIDSIDKPSVSRIIASIFHPFFTALCISTRIAGIIIIGISAIVFLIRFILNKEHRKGIFLFFFIFICLSGLLTIIFNPASWPNPYQYFYEAITQNLHFPIDLVALYDSQTYQAGNLPWHYLPVWISITTPLFIIIGFIVDQVILGIECIRRLFPHGKFHTIQLSAENIYWLIMGLWLYLPIFSYYFLRSTIYDGWRHLFFIYPSIVIFATGGFRYLFQFVIKRFGRRKILVIPMIILLIVGLLEPLIYMIQYHPFQNVYFSSLAGDYSTIRYRYEMDYWGLSFKQGIDAILSRDPSEKIAIYVPRPSGGYYVQYMLDQNQQSRIIFVDGPSKADYFITEYRFHPQDYPYSNKFFKINIRGMEILTVFKMNK